MLVMARLVLMGAGKGLMRALPLVGVAIGGGVNKVLTTRVGHRCRAELLRRQRTTERDEQEDVVDAKVAPPAAEE